MAYPRINSATAFREMSLEYWELLFDVETGQWKDEIMDEFQIDQTDLLIIDCIEIYPPFRGQVCWLSSAALKFSAQVVA